MILAARLSGKAATGQILVSQRSYAAIEAPSTRRRWPVSSSRAISHPVTAWNVLGLREA